MTRNATCILFTVLVFIDLIKATQIPVNGVSPRRFVAKERNLSSRLMTTIRSQLENSLNNSMVLQPRSAYWFPTTCDSLAERGYTCYSCGEALHCMLGNFGLMAFCMGRRPYCNNGVCSDLPGTKCNKIGPNGATGAPESITQATHSTIVSESNT